MSNIKPRVKAPKTAKVGEIVEIKSLITHEMESGQRKDKDGAVIPRKIINKFVATANGKEVFSAAIAPAISANPYIAFKMKVEAATELKLVWTEDGGAEFSDVQNIAIG